MNESSHENLLDLEKKDIMNLVLIKINKISLNKISKNRNFQLNYKYLLIIIFLIISYLNIIKTRIYFIFLKKENIEMEIDKNITVPSNKYKNTSNYNIINTNEMNNFITLCKNKTLLNKNPKYSQKPKITALLPVYNANEFIISTIRSIQNQNMEDIEIIIVDDCSTDNSLEEIERLQKEDKRIKLIKNQINRRTLYSRSIGALNSKGKYIMTIDNDDYFTNNIFNISYEEAENDDIQLLEFTGCDKHINSLFKNNTCAIDIFLSTGKRDGEIIRQPELSDYIYVKKGNDYSLIDLYLLGKCIRSSLYKKALKTIGEAIYTQNVCWSEVRIVNFALFRIARSFKFIKIIGIIHNWRATSVGISFRKIKTEYFMMN